MMGHGKHKVHNEICVYEWCREWHEKVGNC